MTDKYILDTHALVWYLEGNPRLGSRAKAIIDDKSKELVLPIIALAEAAFIIENGKTSIPSVADLILSVDSNPSIELYPLNRFVFDKTLLATAIPEMHDRQIVATALCLNAVGYTVAVLTKDESIKNSGLVPIIW